MNQHSVALSKRAGFQNCLIVEDSRFDQQRMCRVMNRSFADVELAVASNIAQARQYLERCKAQLILLDNNLPDGTGANFALELSRDPRFADITVIMVSDWPSPFMFDKANTAGVVHVVSKSDFGARYIHAAMDKKLGSKRLN